MAFNPLFESANILYNEEGNYGAEIKKIMTVLEDVNSPVTRKYQETLFKSVIDKGHVDFGDIPNSAGNIKNYKGYQPMVETLNVIEKLAAEQNVKDGKKPVNLCGYSYYRDNPALSINEVVKKIFTECGVLPKRK